jgi:hypothetical protein
MIRREQLAAALDRLDPADAKLLSLSPRRRVPDKALASVYGLEPSEVARRRTAAHSVRQERNWLAVQAPELRNGEVGWLPASFGCMSTDSRRARWLIETIPLGAPIFIRS